MGLREDAGGKGKIWSCEERSGEGMSKWDLEQHSRMVTFQRQTDDDGRHPAGDGVEKGEGIGLDTNEEQGEEGGGKVGILADTRGANYKDIKPSGSASMSDSVGKE